MESDIGGGAAAAAAPTTVIEPSGCYGGGDIAGAVIGSLIGGIVLAYLLYRLYVHYWRNRKGEQTKCVSGAGVRRTCTIAWCVARDRDRGVSACTR